MPNVLERLKEALAGRYTVESEIGRGGMATVFLAEDLRHHRQVALKVINPDISSEVAIERFLREIEIVAGLTHPHILPLFDSGQADGLLFCVMPYVAGESLLHRMQREKQLPLEDALQITLEVAEALTYAHERGIIHRDIKPGNILLEEGHAMVADFGIARAVEQAGGARITQTGVAVGTPAYMSPEQGTGSGDVDGRTDIYALGCVLFEMLAGDPPYTGVTPLSVIKRHALEPVPRVRTVRETTPEAVEYAITRAMSKVPADRFRTAAEMAGALTAPPPAKARRSPRPRTAVLAIVGILAVLVAGWQLAERLGGPGTGEAGGPDGQPREMRITETGRAFHPALSPDGRFLAYIESAEPFDRNLANAATTNLRLMLVETSETGPGEARLVTPVQRASSVTWSPDGQSLALYGRVRDSRGLFIISPFGSQVTRVTTESAQGSDWAPDGRRLVGLTGRMRQIGIFALTEDGTAEATHQFQLNATYDRLWDVAWSPGGDRLAVVSDSAGIWTVWSVSPDGSNLEPLVTEDSPIPGVAWSPPGDAIYYHRNSAKSIVRLALTGDGAGDAMVVAPDCGYDFSVARYTGALACERTAPRDARFRIASPVSDTSIDLDLNPAFRKPPVASSDGAMLAYAEDGPDGSDLVVYSLASGARKRITFRGDLSPSPGSIAWSPDDAFIAYTAPGPDGSTALWFVPSAGGVSIRAGDLSPQFEVVWGTTRDPIVQMPGSEWRVLAPPAVFWDSALVRGGVLTGVTGRPLAAGDSAWTIVSPVFSPSGDRVAVYWNRGQAREGGSREDAGIWLLSRDGASKRLLARRGFSAVAPRPFGWTDSGDGIYVAVGSEIHVVDVADGGMTKLFDPGGYCSAVLPGERFVCVDDVAEVDIWVIPDFDQHPRSEPDTDTSTDATIRARREIQVTHTGRLQEVALSPDGEYVVYAERRGMFRIDRQNDPPGGFDLLLARVEDPQREPRLIVPIQAIYDLEWAPDGSVLALSGRIRERDGLFLIPPFGGREISRLDSTVYVMLSWAPEGDRLAAVRGSMRTIQILEPGSAGTVELIAEVVPETTYDRIWGIAWSPGGDRLTAVVESKGKEEIWSIAVDGSGQMLLATEDDIGPGLTWSPAADALYYAREVTGNELVRLSISDDGFVVGHPQLLGGDCDGLGGVSSDGRRLLCGRTHTSGEVWLKSADPTVDSVQVAVDRLRKRGLSVSPDGQRVAYVASSGSSLDLYVLDLPSRTSRQITHRGDLINRTVPWSPDGRYIAYRTFGPTYDSDVWFVPSTGGQSVRAAGIAEGYFLAWAPAADPMVSASDHRNWLVLEPPVRPWDVALGAGAALAGIQTRELVARDSLGFLMLYPVPSPDGNRVAVFWSRGPATPGGGRYRRDAGIWIISLADASAELAYRWRPGTDRLQPLSWTPDGTGLYLRSGPQVHLLEIATGELQMVADFGTACTGPVPGDGRFVCLEDVVIDAFVIENFDPHVE